MSPCCLQHFSRLSPGFCQYVSRMRNHDVSRLFSDCHKDVSRLFPIFLQHVSRMTQGFSPGGGLQVDAKLSPDWHKIVSRSSPGCLQLVSGLSPGCLWPVSMMSNQDVSRLSPGCLQFLASMSPSWLQVRAHVVSRLSPNFLSDVSRLSPGCFQLVYMECFEILSRRCAQGVSRLFHVDSFCI